MSENLRTVCITGSAGGIGAATRARFEKEGDAGRRCRRTRRGGDRRSLDSGRARTRWSRRSTEGCDGVLDGLVAAAGIMGERAARRRDQLLRRDRDARRLCDRSWPRGTAASAVAISSNSTTTTPGCRPPSSTRSSPATKPLPWPRRATRPASFAYPASKLALARLGTPSRADDGVDRRGHPAQRDRAGRDRDADDEERSRVHLQHPRRVPGADRPARAVPRRSRACSRTCSRPTRVSSAGRSCSPTAAPTRPCAPTITRRRAAVTLPLIPRVTRCDDA